MKERRQLNKQNESGETLMTLQNLKICVQNQEGYETLYLNDSLHLQYYNFSNINNLQYFSKIQGPNQDQSQEQQNSLQIKGVNTLFLNNNLIKKIQNLGPLSKSLVTLNLAHNKISKIQGLIHLFNLVVLDLSYNQIKEIPQNQIKTLNKLNRLNLAGNLFTNKQSIQAITILNQSLQSIDLSHNNSFSPEADEILPEVFAKMNQIKVLSFKETPFLRMTSAYRKKVILAMSNLTFLDDRPVTDDQRKLAKAWSQGGVKAQNQARKLIREDKFIKNRKIMGDIEQRQKIVDQKVQKLFQLKAGKQLSELQKLQNFIKSQDFQMLTTEEQSLTRLKIDELERYLQLLREQCRTCDLDKQLGLDSVSKLPKMLIQKRTSECVYVYNVDQNLLEELKAQYYSEQTLPIKIVNYEKPKQIEWLGEYEDILKRSYDLCKGNWEMTVPAFNLQIYDFNQQSNRKIKRFDQTYLRKKFQQIQSHNPETEASTIINQSPFHINSSVINVNQLDCLD